MDQILDFEKKTGADFRFTIVEFVKSYLARVVGDDRLRLGNPDKPSGNIDAEINAAFLPGRYGWQGRWIVRCQECGGAEYVDLRKPIFMCCSCFNAANDHQWFKIKLPKAKTSIEALLLKREGKARNWRPGETVEQLAAENRRHGIEQ